MENNLHLVEFDKWCESCKHKNRKDTEEPCDSCIEVPARPDSRKPERWEADE